MDKFVKQKNLSGQKAKNEKDRLLKLVVTDPRYRKFSALLPKKDMGSKKKIFKNIFNNDSFKKVARFLLLKQELTFEEIFSPKGYKKSGIEKYLVHKGHKVDAVNKQILSRKLKRRRKVFRQYFDELKQNLPWMVRKHAAKPVPFEKESSAKFVEDEISENDEPRVPENYQFLCSIETKNSFDLSNGNFASLLNENGVFCVLNMKKRNRFKYHSTIYLYCKLENCRKFIAHCFSDKVDLYFSGNFLLLLYIVPKRIFCTI